MPKNARKKPQPSAATLAAAAPATAAPQRVGRVTPSERDEIRALHERKNGLQELVVSLQGSELLTNPLFYDKIVADLGKTVTRFNDWWNEKAKAYGWKNIPGGKWTIDFESCEIFLNAGHHG